MLESRLEAPRIGASVMMPISQPAEANYRYGFRRIFSLARLSVGPTLF